MVHCFFEGAESSCAIDQQKPGLKSIAQYFTVILKVHYHDSNMCL